MNNERNNEHRDIKEGKPEHARPDHTQSAENTWDDAAGSETEVNKPSNADAHAKQDFATDDRSNTDPRDHIEQIDEGEVPADGKSPATQNNDESSASTTGDFAEKAASEEGMLRQTDDPRENIEQIDDDPQNTIVKDGVVSQREDEDAASEATEGSDFA